MVRRWGRLGCLCLTILLAFSPGALAQSFSLGKDKNFQSNPVRSEATKTSSGDPLRRLADALLPRPRELDFKEGDPLSLDQGVAVCLLGFSSESRISKAADRWLVESMGMDSGSVTVLDDGWNPLGRCAEVAQGRMVLVLQKVPQDRGAEDTTPRGREGFSLVAGEGGIVAASEGEAGAFYALQLLWQVAVLRSTAADELAVPGKVARNVTLPRMVVRDWPGIANRGLMLDISRNRVHTPATLRSYLDMLAGIRMNQLQFYTEHTFAYPGCEEVWEGTGALTPEEVLELAEYAHARFVELVPNQQSFGHLQHWLKLDKWKHLAELPEGTSNLFTGDYCCAMWDDPENMPNILSPDNASLAFLNERFAALLPSFPYSRLLNVGLDETFELGEGKSRPEVAKRGRFPVYVAFLRSIAALAKDNFNTTIQWWGDVDAEQQNAGDAAPPTGIIMEWGYEAHHPFKQRGLGFQRRKQRFYVAPGTSAWNSIGGRLSNSFSNIANAAASAASTGAEGLLLTDWGDNGHVQPPVISFMPILLAADLSWHLEGGMGSLTETMERVTAAMAAFVVPHRSGALGRALIAAGRAYLLLGPQKLANRNALFDLIFLPNRKSSLVKDWVLSGQQVTLAGIGQTGPMLEAALKELAEMPNAELQESEVPGGLGGWGVNNVRRELAFVLRLMLTACGVGELATREGRRGVIDLAKLAKKDGATEVGKEIENLAVLLRELWALRTRPGKGLEDSVARMMHSARLLQGDPIGVEKKAGGWTRTMFGSRAQEL